MMGSFVLTRLGYGTQLFNQTLTHMLLWEYFVGGG